MAAAQSGPEAPARRGVATPPAPSRRRPAGRTTTVSGVGTGVPTDPATDPAADRAPATGTTPTPATAPVDGTDDPLFSGYLDPDRRNAGAHDEMFAPDGSVRPVVRALHAALTTAGCGGLAARSEAVGRAYTDRGITFSLSGKERPIPLDPVPRIIGAGEWHRLERGLVQRVRALEMFLADVYGPQEILRDRVLPHRLVTSCAHFRRQVAGLVPPSGVRIHVAGIDVVRDSAGTFRVLEDNLRCPSGVSYVIENRRTMTRVFPDLFTRYRVEPVQDYAAMLLHALRAAAPDRPDPTVVVLTPGIYNSAYFEHSLLARQMGVELVEGRDLHVHDDVLYMRTTSGQHRVDVVYRRIDDDYVDPLQFHPESVLGVAGLLNAARAGNVVLANAVGTGVGDDKLVYTYVPDMIRYYLGEPVLLPNVDTIRCWLPDELADAMARADTLVFKPVEGSGGYGIVFGRDCDDRQLAALRRRVTADPRGWIAQPVVELSTVPTWVDGKLVPRHVDLRPFVVNDGERVTVLAGGLTRVALQAGNLVVNSSQGGGGKDTWVLAGRREQREPHESRLPHQPGQQGQAQQQGQAALQGQRDRHGQSRRPGEPAPHLLTRPVDAADAEFGPEMTESQHQQQQHRDSGSRGPGAAW